MQFTNGKNFYRGKLWQAVLMCVHSIVFQVINTFWANQRKFFENTKPCSKFVLKHHFETLINTISNVKQKYPLSWNPFKPFTVVEWKNLRVWRAMYFGSFWQKDINQKTVTRIWSNLWRHSFSASKIIASYLTLWRH